MKQRPRIYYSAAQRSEIWDRWQAGEPIVRQDVEGIRLDFVIVLARVRDIEIGYTVNPKDDSFAIDDLICSTPRATRKVFQTS